MSELSGDQEQALEQIRHTAKMADAREVWLKQQIAEHVETRCAYASTKELKMLWQLFVIIQIYREQIQAAVAIINELVGVDNAVTSVIDCIPENQEPASPPS